MTCPEGPPDSSYPACVIVSANNSCCAESTRGYYTTSLANNGGPTSLFGFKLYDHRVRPCVAPIAHLRVISYNIAAIQCDLSVNPVYDCALLLFMRLICHYLAQMVCAREGTHREKCLHKNRCYMEGYHIRGPPGSYIVRRTWPTYIDGKSWLEHNLQVQCGAGFRYHRNWTPLIQWCVGCIVSVVRIFVISRFRYIRRDSARGSCSRL